MLCLATSLVTAGNTIIWIIFGSSDLRFVKKNNLGQNIKDNYLFHCSLMQVKHIWCQGRNCLEWELCKASFVVWQRMGLQVKSLAAIIFNLVLGSEMFSFMALTLVRICITSYSRHLCLSVLQFPCGRFDCPHRISRLKPAWDYPALILSPSRLFFSVNS